MVGSRRVSFRRSMNLRVALLLTLAAAMLPFAASAQTADAPPEEFVPRPSIHEREWREHLGQKLPEPEEPASSQAVPELYRSATPEALTRTVFGFMVNWRVTDLSHVQWNLLSHVAYFSVTLNSDGSITNLSGSYAWPSGSYVSALRSAARANGVKIVLCANNFTGSSISTLLSSATNRQNAINNLKALVQGYGDGVNIDFENVPASQKANFVTFMTSLASAFHTAIPGSHVSACTPAVDWSSAWDYNQLATNIDGLFIMAYDYHWTSGPDAGPVSPLTGWGTYNVTWTVNDYLAKVSTSNRSKLILGVPYYGDEWPTASTSVPSSTTGVGTSYIYSTARATATTYGRRWDAASQTPYYVYNSGGAHQGWYDDAESLGYKWDLVNSKGLGGTGIWALNYDTGDTLLWNQLQAKFASVTQTCNSLTTVRSPSAGGSITANPTVTVPCNFGYYLTSTPISLQAFPSPGYQFSGWSGSGGSFSSQTLASTTFTITANAEVTATFTPIPVNCSYSINPISAPGVAIGGTGSVQVNGTPSGCTGNWSATASSSGGWLSLPNTNKGNGSGNWTVDYSYPANPSTTSSRSGTVAFSGAFSSSSTFTLTQSASSPGPCSYSFTPPSASGNGSGGNSSVQVTGSPSGCSGSWSASPSSSGGWLSIGGTTGANGSGSWQISYSYPANPSTSSTRSGTISLSTGATFTLTQNPAPIGACSYSITPPSSTGLGSGGSGSVQVTGSPSGCSGSWSASPSSSGGWLTLPGTTSGAGSGAVNVQYSYGANPSLTSTRSATIVFSGSFSATFTLTQDPAAGSASDLIVDGGFESATGTGNSAPGWSITPGLGHTTIRSGELPHAGSKNAYLGGSDLSTDLLSQTLTIPLDATAANLTFWANVVTQEAPGYPFDHLYVDLYEQTGEWIGTISSLSNEDSGGSANTDGHYFKVGPIDMTAFKGRTLRLVFEADTDFSLPTIFRIDDVSLSASSSCATPNISQQPQSISITPGQTAQLSVTPSGTGPFNYAWYQTTATGSVAIGTNSSSLSVAPSSTTQYFVWVTNACGAVLSDAATVTVDCAPLSIVTQPSSTTIASGQPAVLSVTPSGTGPFTYSWYRLANAGSVLVQSGASPSLTVAPSSTTDYFVWIYDSCGHGAISNLTTVTVSAPCTPLSITSQPAAVTINSGQSVTLSVSASGPAPLVYYWYRISSGGSVLVQAGPSASLAVAPSTTTDYFVWVYPGCGTPLVSNVARVTVATCAGPSITSQPASIGIAPGQSTTLTVGAAGTAPLAYYWYRLSNSGSTLVQAGPSASLAVSPSQTTEYFAWVYGNCGTPVSSNVARVTLVCSPPSISTHPSSTTISPGQSTTLNVTASGTSPLSYYWYRIGSTGSVLVQTGSSPSLAVAPATTTDYFVWVYGPCGAVVSNVARVTVSCVPVTVSQHPASSTSQPGQTVQLSVAGSGTGPFAYQWYQLTAAGSVPVGTSSPALTVSPATTSQYFAWIYNACGAAISNLATITINCTPVSYTSQPLNVAMNAGQTAFLSVSVTGTGGFSYQWYQLGPNGSIALPNSNSAAIFVAPPVTTQYFVWTYNPCGAAISNLVTVTVH